jgi:hypothetical protein
MSDLEPKVPIYYVANAALSEPEMAFVLSALQITPVLACVIVDPKDCDFALQLSGEVMKVDSLDKAHLLAKDVNMKTGRPLIILGEANFLDAYYADGTSENVAHCA